MRTHPTRTTTIRAVAIAGTLALVAAACGGSDGDADPPASAAPSPDGDAATTEPASSDSDTTDQPVETEPVAPEVTEPAPPGESDSNDLTGPAGDIRGITDDTIKIGVPIDFSGPFNAAAPFFRGGLDAYVADVNENGGVQGRQIDLVYEDNGADPNTTVDAVNKLIFDDEVFALVGPVGSAATSAILDLADEEQVVTLPIAYADSLFEPARAYTFVPATPYANQIARGVEWAAEEFGADVSMGLLFEDDDFGEAGKRGFDLATDALGLTVAGEEAFPRGADDLSAQTRSLVDGGASIIVCVCAFGQSGLLAQTLSRTGAEDIAVLALNPTIGPPFFSIAGEAASNTYAADYIAHPGSKAWDEVVAILEPRLDTPVNQFHLLTVVNMAILIEALNTAEELSPDGVVAALEAFDGVTVPGYAAPISFPDGRRFASTEAAVFESDPAAFDWTEVSPLAEAASL